jgi:hypothetical protein
MERFRVEIENYYYQGSYGDYSGWRVKLIRRDEFPEWYSEGLIESNKNDEDKMVKGIMENLPICGRREIQRENENEWLVYSYYDIGD